MKGTQIFTIAIISLFFIIATSGFGQTPQDSPPVKVLETTEENNLSDEGTDEEQSTDALKKGNEKKSELNRKRIVDQEYLDKMRSPFGDALMKPFRSIAPAVTSRVAQFEEKREFEYLFGIKTGLPIQPQFGSARPGSGFGVGFTASTGDFFTDDLKFVVSTLATPGGYVETTGGLEYTPQKFAKDKFRLELKGNHSIRPKEDFYGSGAGSNRSSRTTFFNRQAGIRLEASFKFNQTIKVGGFTEITRNDITDGSDSRGVPITGAYKPGLLPGLERGIRLHDSGAFVELDKRDQPENAHLGWYTRFTFTNTNGLSGNGFGWRNYKIDSRAYIPIGSKLRTLALRFQGDFNDKKNTGEVPFFRLASLGSDETLRGYELNRFRGLNSVHLNVEYRFKLMQGFTSEGFESVEAIVFSDIGQVYNDLGELGGNNIRATWGGGFQFVADKGVALAVLYAKSPEKGRLIFRFGKTF